EPETYLDNPSRKTPRGRHASPASSRLNPTFRVVRAEGLEPPRPKPPEPKSGVSTSSTTPADTPKAGLPAPARDGLHVQRRPGSRRIWQERQPAPRRKAPRTYIWPTPIRSMDKLALAIRGDARLRG